MLRSDFLLPRLEYSEYPCYSLVSSDPLSESLGPPGHLPLPNPLTGSSLVSWISSSSVVISCLHGTSGGGGSVSSVGVKHEGGETA